MGSSEEQVAIAPMMDAGTILFGEEQKAIDYVLSDLLHLSVTGKDHIYEWLNYSSIDT